MKSGGKRHRNAATIARTDRAMLENALYVGLSRQLALRRQMDAIANNIANMNTTGFKKESVMFEQALVDARNSGPRRDKIAFATERGTYRTLRDGPLTPTGNPLDLAISGSGYFQVQTDDGARYTRNGNFRINADGFLTTNEGFLVLDDSGLAAGLPGSPIEIGTQTTNITITDDGLINTPDGPMARLALARFDAPQEMRKTGNSLYSTDEPPKQATDSTVRQGMLEGSNVQAVIEMTRMIDVLRSYQSTQKLLETDNDLQRRAIERLAQVS